MQRVRLATIYKFLLCLEEVKNNVFDLVLLKYFCRSSKLSYHGFNSDNMIGPLLLDKKARLCQYGMGPQVKNLIFTSQPLKLYVKNSCQ